MMRRFIALAASLAILSGCENMTQQQKAAGIGTLGGATGGAIIGALAGNAALGTAIGAGAGLVGGLAYNHIKENQEADEVQQATGADGMLPLDIDPKLAWALRFRESFPVDVNRAPREALLRVPGLGVKAVKAIIAARRWRRLRLDDVVRLTGSIAKVRPFIVADGWRPTLLADRTDLESRLKPRAKQLELFAA